MLDCQVGGVCHTKVSFLGFLLAFSSNGFDSALNIYVCSTTTSCNVEILCDFAYLFDLCNCEWWERGKTDIWFSEWKCWVALAFSSNVWRREKVVVWCMMLACNLVIWENE